MGFFATLRMTSFGCHIPFSLLTKEGDLRRLKPPYPVKKYEF